jgi:hypothetical protein
MGSVVVDEYHVRMEDKPSGWITITKLDDGETIIYGVFPSIELAIQFGHNLINAHVKPIYAPTLH